MSNYCFAEAEERRALFTEAMVRGWVAALCDFPRQRNREECSVPADLACDVLRSEVCCIPNGDDYQRLISSAWVAAYVAVRDAPEREIAQMVYAIKVTSIENVLSTVRHSFASAGGQAEIEKAWAQYVEATQNL